MRKTDRILVIRLGAFGDVVLSFGAMAAVRAHHPEAHITFMTTAPFARLLAHSPYVNSVWTVERFPWWRADAWLQLRQEMKDRDFDLVYDLQRNDRTSFMRALATPPLKKAWLDGRRSMAGALDIKDGQPFPLPDLSWMTADTARFGIRAPFVLLVPGSAPQHPKKRWPAASYAELASALQKKGYTPVILGTAADTEVSSSIAEAVPETVNLSSQTSFTDIAALAREAACAIGNDTGPMHLISLAGCPCVSLFSGESNPEQSAPRGKTVSILRADPIGGIGVAAVLAAVERITETRLR